MMLNALDFPFLPQAMGRHQSACSGGVVGGGVGQPA